MHRGLLAALLAAGSLSCAVRAGATELVTNGNFATGDLTGWTLSILNGGSIGYAPDPQVTVFNVTGAGPTNAAEFQVGSNISESPGGVRLAQTVVSEGGQVAFHMDLATLAGSNADGGTFTAYLVGVGSGLFASGPGLGRPVTRGSIDFAAFAAAGEYQLFIDITRTYLNGTSGPGIVQDTGYYGQTPLQYVTNISLTQAVAAGVPDPAVWAMLVFGFAAVGACLRFQRSVGRAIGLPAFTGPA